MSFERRFALGVIAFALLILGVIISGLGDIQQVADEKPVDYDGVVADGKPVDYGDNRF